MRTVGKSRDGALPATFKPEFWSDQDLRVGLAREVNDRLRRLRADTGADSAQKDLLCQRAVFVALQLETMEVRATRDGRLDPGVYTQMVNALLGLLKALGLERAVRTAGTLREYIGGGSQ